MALSGTTTSIQMVANTNRPQRTGCLPRAFIELLFFCLAPPIIRLAFIYVVRVAQLSFLLKPSFIIGFSKLCGGLLQDVVVDAK